MRNRRKRRIVSHRHSRSQQNMSQEELPDATIEELTACGLRLKTPPATTFKAFGIDLVDKLFNVSSLTYAQVVKKTLPSGACLFTTCGRASGLKETQYASSVTVPNCFVDEHLSRLKELWIFDDTVLALTTQEKNAVKDLRLHKIHFEICISDLGKQRMVHRLPTEATPRPPPESRLIFSVTWNNTTNKPEYSFTRDDAQFEESGIIENGSVKFFLPRDAVWIKSRSETAHYFLTQVCPASPPPSLADGIGRVARLCADTGGEASHAAAAGGRWHPRTGDQESAFRHGAP